jgi:hypothetical protein
LQDEKKQTAEQAIKGFLFFVRFHKRAKIKKKTNLAQSYRDAYSCKPSIDYDPSLVKK